MNKQLVEQFSSNLWGAANTLVVSIYAIAFGAYAIIISANDFAKIANQIEDAYFLLSVCAVVGNLLILFGLARIGHHHKLLIQTNGNDQHLIQLIDKATRFRMIAVGANFAMYIGILSYIKFDGV